MSIPSHRDALFLRMAELLQALELFDFLPMSEGELAQSQDGWEEIKVSVETEVAAIKEETP